MFKTLLVKAATAATDKTTTVHNCGQDGPIVAHISGVSKLIATGKSGCFEGMTASPSGHYKLRIFDASGNKELASTKFGIPLAGKGRTFFYRGGPGIPDH